MKIYLEDGIEFELVKKTKNIEEAKILRSEIGKKGYNARVRHFYKDKKVISYGVLKSLKPIDKGKPKKEQKLSKEQRLAEYKRKEAIEVAKAMKLPIEKLKWNLQYHDKEIKKYEKEVDKNPTYFNYESLSYHRNKNMIYHDALHQKKMKSYKKKSELAEKLHERYPEDNYGYDFDKLGEKVKDILVEKGFDEDKAWDLVGDIVYYHMDYLNMHLGTINWRKDLINDIENKNMYPELKGRFIPQLSYINLQRKDFINVANDIAKDFKKEQNITFTKSEINVIKKTLREYI